MTAFGHSDFLQALGWAVLNSLWQMALLWIVFNVALSFSSSIRPSQKSKWAAGLLITGFLWFAFTFISIFITNDKSHSLVALNTLSTEVNQDLNTWLEKTLPFASIAYILLLAIPVLRFVRNYRYVQVLRRYDLGKIPIEWRMFVKKTAEQIGITKQVNIWVSGLISSPVTIGYLKPIILVPLAAVANLTPHQMEAVLLHELAHIRRHDYLINLIINCIQTVLYFNPFVKVFVKTIERERERSCDELVIQFQYDPHNYASALLMLEKNSINAQQMAIAASGKSDLLSRIERILNIEKRQVFSFNKMAGLFAGLLCIIVLNALVIVSKPFSKNGGFAFENIGSPAFFFSDEEGKSTPVSGEPASKENENENLQPSIENHVAPPTAESPAETENEIASTPAPGEDFNYSADLADFKTVNGIVNVMPQLSKQELKQVQITLNATKEVMEKAQWKEIEKSIADALTQLEKENVKQEYLRELGKINWTSVEEKMKIAYDNINWEKVNDKLNNAIIDIKLDSLEQVYIAAEDNLDAIEAEVESGTDAFPRPVIIATPGISLEKIKANKQIIRTNLEKVRAIRDRKIIHL